MGIPDGGKHLQFEAAQRLASRCRPRAALEVCDRILRAQPDNAHAHALKARLEVALNLASVEEASELTERLVAQYPEDSYLQVAKAVLLVKGRDRDAATSALRVVAQRHPSDAYVHQVLAGQLGCDRATWPEAWEHWKLALQSGPLISPTFKGAAYALARRLEPAYASSALSGCSRSERLALKTRSYGISYLFAGFALVVVLGGLVGWKDLKAGVALGLIATAWGLWCAYTNFYVGCWKCMTVWLAATALLWPFFVLVVEKPFLGPSLLVGLFLGWVSEISKAKRNVRPKNEVVR